MRVLRSIGILGLVFATALPSPAATLSKKFKFRSDTVLEIGEDVGDGVRLDSVKFMMPEAGSTGMMRNSGLGRAEVTVSNTGQESRKVGVAIAVFNDAGDLVAVASGGSVVRGIRPFRQVGYSLDFDYVNNDLTSATTFQITVETKP